MFDSRKFDIFVNQYLANMKTINSPGPQTAPTEEPVTTPTTTPAEPGQAPGKENDPWNVPAPNQDPTPKA